MTSVNVYDFDNTIYAGDATIDFYLFCLKRHPRLLRYLPAQLWHTALFALRLEDRTVFKGNFFAFLRGLTDSKQATELFWGEHYSKIKPWYLKADHSRDVIVSSSPEFLLTGAIQRLGALALIATRMDEHTGRINGENCRGAEKVKRFQKEFGGTPIESAYSDHLSDLPLLRLAKAGYLVKGDAVTPLPAAQAEV